MLKRVNEVLNNQGDNYILPFFWQQGETEEVLRDYMAAIQNAGIGAVCLEARPHPDFAGPLWWRDLDIILDEARTRDMKVWILDDAHFPTGRANGALKTADAELCKLVTELRTFNLCGPSPQMNSGYYQHGGPPKRQILDANDAEYARAFSQSLPAI